MKMQITLLYDPHCPNADLARENIRRALEETSLPQRWREIDTSVASASKACKNAGSPTVLVGGIDVATAPDGATQSCRLYTDQDGVAQRAPTVEMIVQAIHRRQGQHHKNPGLLIGLWRGAISLPAAGAGFVPLGLCPACLPAYLGFLSAAGMGFLLQTKYLLGLTLAMLALALAGLAYKARTRRGLAPLAVGAAGATAIILGRFVLASDWILYIGAAILIGTSIWNAWPRRGSHSAPCRSCAQPSAHAPINVTRTRSGDIIMNAKRKIEVFTAGCPVCDEAVQLVRSMACESCEVEVLDMHEPPVAKRAKDLGVHALPAVVIDGELSPCCAGSGIDEDKLREAGVGRK